MIDNLTRILLTKYSPNDPRLIEVEEPSETVQAQKDLEAMSPSLMALIADEVEKAKQRKKKEASKSSVLENGAVASAIAELEKRMGKAHK